MTRRRWSPWIVPLAYAIVVILTLREYGITWDESRQMRYGELVLAYFRSGFTNRTANSFFDLRFYGPLFEIIPAMVWQFAPALKYDIHHLFIALAALGTIIATGRFATYADAEPFFAQLALVALPQFYGHSFNNSKDIPLACALTWSLVALSRGTSAVFMGLAIGSALAIRAGSAPLIVAASLVVILTSQQRRAMVKRLAVAAVIAWLVMIAFWPWAHESPIRNPIAAMVTASKFTRVNPVMFEGRYIDSNVLPRRYLVEMLAITTPLPMIALALAGVVLALRRARSTPAALLVVWILIPLIGFTIARPDVYDGVRHFLFLMPAFAIASSISVTALIRRWPLWSVRVGAAVMIAFAIVPMWRLHPYEMTYYNALVGGTRGASGRFDTDYWTSSYREAALWIRDNACTRRHTRILVAANEYWIDCLQAYLPADRFVVVGTLELPAKGEVPPIFDYYVGTTRWGFAWNYLDTPVAHVVGRDSAPFTVIRGRKKPC